jgi:hypothetical protein
MEEIVMGYRMKQNSVLLAAVFMAACGGGGGGGGSSSNNNDDNDTSDPGGGVTGTQLEIFESPTSGLQAIHPDSPGSILTLDADAEFSNVNSIPVLGATWNNGQTDNGYIRELVYQDASDRIMRVSTDGSSGTTPTPQRVSSIDDSSSQTVFDICKFNIGQDFVNVDNATVAMKFCNNSTDPWWVAKLSWGNSKKPEKFPGTPLVDLVDPADGSHDGWLGLENGEIKHLAPDALTVTTVTGSPTGISSATHLESIQTGQVMLNIDGNLWVYEPGTGLTDTAYDFNYTTACVGTSPCPILHVVDDSELFFIDNNRLFRTDLANDQVTELDHNSSAATIAIGGRRLAVGTDRVVWSYTTDPNGIPSSGDEKTIIESLAKDGTNGLELHKGGPLSTGFSAQNQPFFDRTGEWFFYTLADDLASGAPTAVAVKLDNSASESRSGAAWVGASTNLISFANLSQSQQYAYLAEGLTDTSNLASKNIYSVPAASPGTRTQLGTTPADTQTSGFTVIGGFDANRLVLLSADDGGSGSQQDIMFLAGDTGGSLQRVTDTPGEDETPAPFF